MQQQDTPVEPHDVLEFWFGELTETDYWTSNDQLDSLIRTRFAQTLSAASIGELWQWRESAEGRLAEIIVLDQFSRNIYRGSGRAYEYDPGAVILAQEAVATGADQMIEVSRRRFMYLPFMHSESLKIHRWSWPLFEQLDENTLNFEKIHVEIIERFGRYPHRNELLGRQYTTDEIEYLQNTNQSFF